jgi:hypothetical protein
VERHARAGAGSNLVTNESRIWGVYTLRVDKTYGRGCREVLAIYQRKGARRLPPLIRDSVSH